eukprot:5420901-Amphidinium_carterae.1
MKTEKRPAGCPSKCAAYWFGVAVEVAKKHMVGAHARLEVFSKMVSSMVVNQSALHKLTLVDEVTVSRFFSGSKDGPVTSLSEDDRFENAIRPITKQLWL